MSEAPTRKLSARMACQTAARRELQQALLAWELSARAATGVSRTHVYEDVVTPGVFGLEAVMATSDALDAHLHSQAFGALLGALNVLAQDVYVSVCQPAPEFNPDALSSIRRMREQ
jgi:hypothetical protein